MDSTAVRLHPAARGPALLTPAADLLLIGGLSLAAFAAYYLLTMFCLMIFINIHHYFIDNVLWRRDNQALRQYL